MQVAKISLNHQGFHLTFKCFVASWSPSKHGQKAYKVLLSLCVLNLHLGLPSVSSEVDFLVLFRALYDHWKPLLYWKQAPKRYKARLIIAWITRKLRGSTYPWRWLHPVGIHIKIIIHIFHILWRIIISLPVGIRNTQQQYRKIPFSSGNSHD